MEQFTRLHISKLVLAAGFSMLVGCVAGPTLHETRRGESLPGPDMTLQPGEIRAEVVQVTPSRNEIQVRADDNRTRVLRYDPARTRVTYSGRDYAVENLEAGDLIAYQTLGRDGTVDAIRVQQPFRHALRRHCRDAVLPYREAKCSKAQWTESTMTAASLT